MSHLDYLDAVVKDDVEGLREKEKEYGGSWKKRGGVGAFMMLCRKWDRLENHLEKLKYDIFEAITNDTRKEGILDDVRDLRGYLILVEAEMRARGVITNAAPPDASVHRRPCRGCGGNAVLDRDGRCVNCAAE
jgi:hypothetical protein